MRLGVVVLPDRRWADAAARWRRAEELGLHHAWTYDHLTWRSFRDEPWLASVPTLAAAALATSTIRLGPLVASPAFRHPVPFAKEVVALDDLSGGRLTVGLGAGGTGFDATALGGPPLGPSERASRFEAFVDLLDRLLREPATTADGPWFSAVEARSQPGCVQAPRAPFAVAARGPRGMRLAARHGALWVTTGPRERGDGRPIPPEEGAPAVAAQVARLEEACAAEGVDPAGLGRLVLTGLDLDPCTGSPERFVDALGRYAEAGATDLVVHLPREAGAFAGDAGEFERAALAGLAAAGPAREQAPPG